MRMSIIPMELRNANVYVSKYHRHHKPVQGHRFSIGAKKYGELLGVAIVGRPVARLTDQGKVIEVTRLCSNGEKNVCSFLYAACARIAKELGYKQIQTFILDTESGISLKAAGWEFIGKSFGGDWTRKSKPNRRQDQPQSPKLKFRKLLNDK